MALKGTKILYIQQINFLKEFEVKIQVRERWKKKSRRVSKRELRLLLSLRLVRRQEEILKVRMSV